MSTEKSTTENLISLKKEKETFVNDYEQVLYMTRMSMKMYANSYYKATTFLEVSDIENIKESLSNYAREDQKITEFKKVIINDLTEFQKQIKDNHTQKLTELVKQKQFCEKQLRVFEVEKNKLIMERLSKIAWPYDHKTKEYDSKIEKLQTQIQKYEQKIEELKNTKPLATEKDILIYQMSLKEKFGK